MDIPNLFDRYSRQARVYPPLLVLLPVPFALLGWFPDLKEPLGGFLSLATACGLLFLLGQLGRDRGKALEPKLFEIWGGKPSVVLLRWSDRRIDRHTKQGYHDFLRGVVPNAKFPTPVEELADPGLAEESYEAATKWLLSKTRDTKLFHLLFGENISYGFRRNVLGLRPFGITVSLLVGGLSTAAGTEHYAVAGQVPPVLAVIGSATGWIMAAWWLLGVRPDWVRMPAEQYGLQLLAACTTLQDPPKPELPKAAE